MFARAKLSVPVGQANRGGLVFVLAVSLQIFRSCQASWHGARARGTKKAAALHGAWTSIKMFSISATLQYPGPGPALRFASLGIPQTEEARRAYRELIVTTPGPSADRRQDTIYIHSSFLCSNQDVSV